MPDVIVTVAVWDADLFTEPIWRRAWRDAKRIFLGRVEPRGTRRVGGKPAVALLFTGLGEIVVFSIPSPLEWPAGMRTGGGTIAGAALGFVLLVVALLPLAPALQRRDASDREADEAAARAEAAAQSSTSPQDTAKQ